MSEKNNSMKILGVLLLVAIIIAAGVYLYVNLPKQKESTEDNETPQTETSVLTLSIDGQHMNYSLAAIEALTPYTEKGGYRTNFPSIKGLGNYTGVPITTFAHVFDESLQNYSVNVSSSDGSYKLYNYSTVLGNVNIYNPNNVSNATSIGYGDLTMVVCYKFEGNYLNESNDGKLKIAFLDQNGSITSAGLWWKKVVSINIIHE